MNSTDALEPHVAMSPELPSIPHVGYYGNGTLRCPAESRVSAEPAAHYSSASASAGPASCRRWNVLADLAGERRERGCGARRFAVPAVWPGLTARQTKRDGSERRHYTGLGVTRGSDAPLASRSEPKEAPVSRNTDAPTSTALAVAGSHGARMRGRARGQTLPVTGSGDVAAARSNKT
ncbi:unnamed protein product [Lampetra fluviatilis]